MKATYETQHTRAFKRYSKLCIAYVHDSYVAEHVTGVPDLAELLHREAQPPLDGGQRGVAVGRAEKAVAHPVAVDVVGDKVRVAPLRRDAARGGVRLGLAHPVDLGEAAVTLSG